MAAPLAVVLLLVAAAFCQPFSGGMYVNDHENERTPQNPGSINVAFEVYPHGDSFVKDNETAIGLALIVGCDGAEYNYDLHSPWPFDVVEKKIVSKSVWVMGKGVLVKEYPYYFHQAAMVLGCYRDETANKLYYRVINKDKALKLQERLALLTRNDTPIKVSVTQQKSDFYRVV